MDATFIASTITAAAIILLTQYLYNSETVQQFTERLDKKLDAVGKRFVSRAT